MGMCDVPPRFNLFLPDPTSSGGATYISAAARIPLTCASRSEPGWRPGRMNRQQACGTAPPSIHRTCALRVRRGTSSLREREGCDFTRRARRSCACRWSDAAPGFAIVKWERISVKYLRRPASLISPTRPLHSQCSQSMTTWTAAVSTPIAHLQQNRLALLAPTAADAHE